MEEMLLAQIATFDYCIKEVEEDIEYAHSNGLGLQEYSDAHYVFITLVSRLKKKREEVVARLNNLKK